MRTVENIKTKGEQMKNKMLLLITMMLCAAQSVYSMENKYEPKFDKSGFLASKKDINNFPDKTIANKLAKIKTFYNKHTISNKKLNTVGHIMMNYPNNKITQDLNKFTITYLKPKVKETKYTVGKKIYTKYIPTTEQITYEILIQNK